MIAVPERVRIVLNTFPLATLPAQELPYQKLAPGKNEDSVTVAVYSTDSDGLPSDPKCLEAVALLVLSGRQPVVEIDSPYITSKQTLPVVQDYLKSKSLLTDPKHIAKLYFPKAAADPNYLVHRQMVETWLADAWHYTVMNDPQRLQVYGSQSATFPWPFSLLSSKRLDAHLEDRHLEARKGTGDDFHCSENDMVRVKMTLDALSEAVTVDGDVGPLDLLVYSYIRPITECFPESALAALVGDGLRAHAAHVHAFIINKFN